MAVKLSKGGNVPLTHADPALGAVVVGLGRKVGDGDLDLGGSGLGSIVMNSGVSA